MKSKYIYNLILCLVCVVGISSVTVGQRCDKKEFCNDEDYGEYDFKSQTHFAKLSPGDTATINIVAYSGNDLRILVCADPELGEVKYQVIESFKEAKKDVKYVKRTEKTPKYDAENNVKFNTNGDTLYDVQNFTDTIVTTKFNVFDKLLFDNGKQTKEKPYYEEKNIKKTKRLKVRIQIPKGGEEDLVSCVNVLVGRKAAKSNKFYRGQD